MHGQILNRVDHCQRHFLTSQTHRDPEKKVRAVWCDMHWGLDGVGRCISNSKKSISNVAKIPYIQWFGFAKDRTRHCFEWKGSPLTGPVLRQSKITTRFWWFVSSLQRRCFVSLADWEKEGFRGPTSSRIAPILAPSIVSEAPGILRLSSLSK